MNHLKQIINTFLKLVAISVVALSFGVSYAYAQTPLEVLFETDPLFIETDIIPGDGVLKTITVTNNSGESQNIIAEAINAVDGDGLGDVLNLVISDGSMELYNDALGDFLRAGEISLSVLPDEEVVIYSFSVSFEKGAGNSTQSGELDFDLCIGFEGGDSSCGDTEIGGEGGTDDGGNPGGGSGGGGGGGGGPINLIRLQIENERTTDVSVVEVPLEDPEGTATIEWDTNLLATSQVIYGPSTDENGDELFYSLNLTVSPYFGYPMGSVEDPIKVTQHTVVLTGLVPDQVYKYRVVSRASPPTVSYEHTFLAAIESPEIPTDGELKPTKEETYGGGVGEEYVPITSEGIALIPIKEEAGTEKQKPEPELYDDIENNNLAAAIFAFPDFSLKCALYLFLILFIIAVLHRLWNKFIRGEVVLAPNEVVTKEGLMFWMTSIAIAILAMYLMKYLCVITPLAALFLILVVWYLVKRYKTQ